MPKSGKISRVKSGCLCCRKRKVKCDESKPSCKTCERLLLVCEWQNPEINVTISWLSSYVPKKKKKEIQFVNFNEDIKPETAPLVDSPKMSKAVVSRAGNTVICLKNDEKNRPQTKTEADVDNALRKYLRELGRSYVQDRCIRGLSNLQMSQQQALFFDAFVNGFMVAVSPQLAHEKLQPSSVVIPRGINDSILMKVFYACGATYLSWNNKEYKKLADSQYQESMRDVRTSLDLNGLENGNESNILIMMVTLCLREKYQCKDRVRNSLFLIAAIKIIYHWIKIRKRNVEHMKTDPMEEYLEGFVLRKELIEIIDTLSNRIVDPNKLEFTTLQYQDGINDNVDLVFECGQDNLLYEMGEDISLGYSGISPFERTMIESFLYNYCVNLLNFDQEMLHYTISPFVLFKDLGSFLTAPIYNTPVYWMNNPIMGASLSAFELVSKANWLRLKMPLQSKQKEAAQRLRNIAKYYIPSLLPESAKFRLPSHIQMKLTESCYVGVLAAKAAYILLTKIIYPNYTLKSADIQEAIETFFKYLHKIPLNSQAGGICIWPFIICGLAIEDPEKRAYLIHRTNAFSEMKKSESQLRLMEFLKEAWKTHDNISEAWNIMCNANGFESVFV